MSKIKLMALIAIFFSSLAQAEPCSDFLQQIKPFDACAEGQGPESSAVRKGAMTTEESLAYEKSEIEYMAAEGAFHAMTATKGAPQNSMNEGADIAQTAINAHRDAFTILAKTCRRLAVDCKAACPMNAACENLNKSARYFDEEASKMSAASWKAGTTSSQSKAKPKAH